MEIDINWLDWIELKIPSGRTISIPSTEQGMKFLVRILRDAKNSERAQRPGYIGAFPTQAVVDQWIADDKEGRERAKREVAAKELGINLDKINIQL